MAGRLAGKVAIITGGARGIGLAGAQMFLREGAKVVIADKDAEASAMAEKELKALGQVKSIVTNVRNPQEVERMVKETVDTFGKLDVLYNNAGYSIVEKVGAADLPLEVWHETIDVNLNGSFYCTKYAIPHMIKNGGGSIMYTASVALDGAVDYNAYATAKGSLKALMRTIAMQYLPQKVRANLIVPGGTKTARIQQRFAAQGGFGKSYETKGLLGINDPEDIAYTAVFFASDESRHISGQTLWVDSGYNVHYTPKTP